MDRLAVAGGEGAQPFGAVNLKTGHSRAERDGQLEELSEAVKLARIKGRISPSGCAEQTVREASER